jgi:hypothetical protein
MCGPTWAHMFTEVGCFGVGCGGAADATVPWRGAGKGHTGGGGGGLEHGDGGLVQSASEKVISVQEIYLVSSSPPPLMSCQVRHHGFLCHTLSEIHRRCSSGLQSRKSRVETPGVEMLAKETLPDNCHRPHASLA